MENYTLNPSRATGGILGSSACETAAVAEGALIDTA